VPHAFQHLLALENTPTLCHAIPAFEAFIGRWEELAEEVEEARGIIEIGVEKLEDYQSRVEEVPAYVIAMGE
jgi:hypothetical protein